MKKLILITIVAVTAGVASDQSISGSSPAPALILGAFAFLFALAFIKPPGRRNLTQEQKQDSLMRSLGVELPPDVQDLAQDEDEPDRPG